MTHLPLLITSGEPAGIGPDLCIELACSGQILAESRPLVVLGDIALFEARAKQLGRQPSWTPIDSLEQAQKAQFYFLPVTAGAPVVCGQINSANARYVLNMLDLACDACLNGQAAAMVTAPLQKSAISPILAGFQGHTEYLAQRCKQADEVVMMLEGGGLRVALATTHLPLTDVPKAIHPEGLKRTLRIMLESLKKYWGIEQPRILVTGLNPHAGESGTMGREEVDVITPVINEFQTKGFQVSGPYPADTLFQPKHLQRADAVLAMYHDQGLPVLKYASFGEGVNISLGLPIIRTSVDHGTALDLAGTGNAHSGSLIQAIARAHFMDLNRSS